ncbi:MAG TPA: YihY/virulence factor BrkB family protein [Methylovirgula sp.]
MDKSKPSDDQSRWSAIKPVWLDLVQDVILSVSRNRLIANSGSVAFFGLMAIFPAIATIVSLYGMFADPHTISNHLNLLTDVFPQSVIGLIRYQVMRVASRGNGVQSLTFFVSFFVALWSANSGMSALFDALNVVYGETEKRSLPRFYGTTLTTTFASVIFVVVALAGVVVLPVVWNFVGFHSSTDRLLDWLRWPVLFLIDTIGLDIVYRVGPSRPGAKWRWLTWGSVFATFAWLGASILFSWYVAAFDSYDRVYGSLGAVIGFMTWIWVSVLIVLTGAALNVELDRRRAAAKGAP